MVSVLWCMSIPLSHASVVQTWVTQIATESKLALLDAWIGENELQANESEAVWVTEKTQTNVSKYPFMGSGCQVLLWIRKQSKKSINLASISKGGKPQSEDVFISLFLTSPDGQGSEQRLFRSKVRQRGRILWGGPLCMILMTKTTKSKSKKQNQNWFFHAIQYHKENSRNYCTEAFQTDRL